MKEFTKSISTFHGKFSEEGPGTVGSDLDEGIYIHICMYVHTYVSIYTYVSCARIIYMLTHGLETTP